MHIALIGATGFVGAPLLEELIRRGHHVTALLREPAKLAPREGLRTARADVLDAAQVAAGVRGADAVISAYNPGWQHPALYERFLEGSRAIVRGAELANVARLLVVGGAGSLYVAPGVQLVDTPAFLDHVPPNIVPGARAARDLLAELAPHPTLQWTFLSPPAQLAPGERSGRYREGGDALLLDAHGAPAGISVRDLAVALVDTLEQGRHVRARYTVAAPL